jgi:hypothetical protein
MSINDGALMAPLGDSNRRGASCEAPELLVNERLLRWFSVRFRPWFLAIPLLASCAPARPPSPGPAAPASAPKASALDALLADYRALGLPMPSANARLVKWELGAARAIRYLAFAEPGTGPDGPQLLIGTEHRKPNEGSVVTPIEPGPEAAEGIRGTWIGARYPTNAALATAIQAKARGWDALATRLLELAAKTAVRDFGAGGETAEAQNKASLAMLARNHYANELMRRGSDWRAIAAGLEAYLAMGAPAQPDLRPFLHSLRATLDHPPSAPGSAEAKIDALCDMGNPKTSDGHDAPALLRVVELGFEAVPALFDHVTDERLTRTMGFGFPPTLRLNQIVIAILEGLAGEDLSNQMRSLQGLTLYRSAMTAWTEAKAMGEEAFLTTHVLSASPNARAPARFALLALAHRHPARLEDVYRAALVRPAMSTELIAQVIAESTLPSTEKVRILEAGASHTSFDRRFIALRALRPMDPAAYARLLARSLDAMPKTPKESYWIAAESAASRLAAETADPTVWAALLRAAKRGDVGLRMELVGRLADPSLADRQRRERLAFLAAFLDDDAVADTSKEPKMWMASRALSYGPGISVGDLAAKTIAAVLGMPAAPKREWTPAEWDALRADVKHALELAP